MAYEMPLGGGIHRISSSWMRAALFGTRISASRGGGSKSAGQPMRSSSQRLFLSYDIGQIPVCDILRPVGIAARLRERARRIDDERV
ncbi:MAG: hypothetical protein ACQEUZ_04605 [Pseudomonadota bacterium]